MKEKVMSAFRSKFYMKSLIMVLSASVIPFLVFSVGSYYLSVSQITKQLEVNQNSHIQRVQSLITEQLENLEKITIKWSFNQAFPSIIESENILKDYSRVAELNQIMNLMRNSHSMIGKVLFYVKDSSVVYDDQLGMVYINSKEQAGFESLMTGTRDFYYVDVKEKVHLMGENTLNTFLVIKINTISNKKDGFIFIGLDRPFIESLFTQFNPEKLDLTFVIQKNQERFIPRNNSNEIHPELLQRIGNVVQGLSNSFGNFSIKDKGEVYAVSYGSYNKNGWKYITVSSLTKLYTPVRYTTRMLTLVGMVCFIIIAAISLLSSNKIYLPVKKLAVFFREGIQGDMPGAGNDTDEIAYIQKNMRLIDEERKRLQENYKKNKELIRESFLLQLIQNHLFSNTEDELKETMVGMGWDCQGESFVAIYLKFFNSDSGVKDASYFDGQLTAISAVTIIKERTSQVEGLLGVLNLHNLSAVMLLGIKDSNGDKIRTSLNSICSTLLKSLTGYLDCKVVIGVGKPTDDVRSIPKSFNEAVQSTCYREVDMGGEIIFYDELIKQTDKAYNFPDHIGMEIVHDLAEGLKEEALEKVKACVGELKKESGKARYIHQGMLHLLGNILQAMISSRFDINRIYSGENLYEQLCMITEPDEIVGWFENKVLLPYINEIVATQEIKYTLMTEKVKQYIEKNYMNDISLDLCSEIAGFPPKRLSNVFSKVTGESFVNYVTRFRMEKAKELLKESDQDIHEIAVQVGYQPSYFIRTFKKFYDITPGEYRNSLRVS